MWTPTLVTLSSPLKVKTIRMTFPLQSEFRRAYRMGWITGYRDAGLHGFSLACYTRIGTLLRCSDVYGFPLLKYALWPPLFVRFLLWFPT